MKNDCVLCVLNQILRVSKLLNLDQNQIDTIFSQALKRAFESDFLTLTAPEFAEGIYGIFSRISGETDLYKTLRRQQNRLVLNKIDYFRNEIARSGDSLYAAAFYSLLGNIIDYGGVDLYDETDLFKNLGSIEPVLNDFTRFRSILRKGKKILVIADNAGEAVFDLLFLEQMGKENPQANFFYAVRSKPAINDVIKEDAESIGIGRQASIVESGSTVPGTVIQRINPEFRDLFFESDLIISKGQGNYETLEGVSRDVLFVFKVKCDVVARHTGLKKGALVFAFQDTIINNRSR